MTVIHWGLDTLQIAVQSRLILSPERINVLNLCLGAKYSNLIFIE
jgi:hypothetical protein